MQNNETNGEQAQEQKVCIACGQKIPKSATVCHNCSSHQVRWKNSLLYFGSVAGIIVVGIALFTYLASIYPAARKTIAWKDNVSVISFYSEGLIVISNRGDGSVFVSHLDISAKLKNEEFMKFAVPINVQIDPGQFYKMDYKNPEKEIEDGIFVQSEDPEDILAYLYPSVNPADKCFEIVFFSTEDPKYIQVSTFLDKLLVYKDIDASITYYSSQQDKKIREPFQVVAAIIHSNNPECAYMSKDNKAKSTENEVQPHKNEGPGR